MLPSAFFSLADTEPILGAVRGCHIRCTCKRQVSRHRDLGDLASTPHTYGMHSHQAQPSRYGSWIEAHASPNPKTGNTTALRQLEYCDPRHRQQFCKFHSCESVTKLFNAVRQRLDLRHGSTPGINSRRYAGACRCPSVRVDTSHVSLWPVVLAGSPVAMAP